MVNKPAIPLTTALTFFKEWTPETAYIFGLLFADGNVCNTPKKRSVSLELKDIDFVYTVADAIDSAIKVTELKRTDGRTSAKFYLSRVSIVEDCIAKGLIPAKTATLQWAVDLPRELESHFVRGYFDGDGTVGASLNIKKNSVFNRRHMAFACGSTPFAESLRDVIQRQTGVRGVITFSVPTCAALQYIGLTKVRALGEWMYQDGGLRLERKYTRWLEVLTV